MSNFTIEDCFCASAVAEMATDVVRARMLHAVPVGTAPAEQTIIEQVLRKANGLSKNSLLWDTERRCFQVDPQWEASAFEHELQNSAARVAA